MNEQEKILVETEQRSKSNQKRLDTLEREIREVKEDQKAIYEIATSVSVIAQRVTTIEEQVKDTNQKVSAQSAAWQEAEHRLNSKIIEAESQPYKRTASNVNSVKLAVITAIATFLATGIAGALIALFANK